MNDDLATLERFRIHELLGRYVDCVNHRDWEQFGDCWVSDGILQVTLGNAAAADPKSNAKPSLNENHKFIGRERILHFVTHENAAGWLFQIPSGISAHLMSPTTGKIRSTLTVNSQEFMTIGICYDRVVKEGDGVWRMAHRDFRPTYTEKMSRSGSISRFMPDAIYKTLP